MAYQYFSLLINKKVYHFVPIEGQEILINRRTKQIVNTETKLAFQKGKDITYFTIEKLTTLSDFMDQINEIIKPYYKQPVVHQLETEKINSKTNTLIEKLEEENIKRLIDSALDRKDKDSFYRLARLL